MILAESERAARIVGNLLTFARKRPSTRSMIDLNQVVRETLALRAYDQRVTDIVVVTALASGLPRSSRTRIRFSRCCSTCDQRRAGDAVGTGAARWCCGRGTTERNAVVLEVTDDGPGVPPEVKNKIFDPFFTTKEVGKGTGLGLTVAYSIVQEHGGSFASIRWSGGASFTVEFPVSSVENGARPRPPRTVDQAPKASVLLVEDERALATAVVEALTEAGLRVDTRATARKPSPACVRTALRRGDLRSQDAARGRHDALSRDCGGDADAGAAA